MTRYFDHKKGGSARPCSANDLFIVREGLQCGNCLALVQDNRAYFTAFRVTYYDGYSYETSTAETPLKDFADYLMQDGNVHTYENPETGEEIRRKVKTIQGIEPA